MNTSNTIKTGRYKHFKGMIVEVVGFATHSETMEEMVIYVHSDPIKGKDANTTWVRPATMFLEHVEKDGYCGPRFIYVGKE